VLTRPDGDPITSDHETHFDELVVSQDAQVMPLFVVEFDPSKLLSVSRKFARNVLHPPGELGEDV